jgi:hypothetical protein
MEQNLYICFNKNIKVMGALELKAELHEYINQGDEKFIKMFYEMAKAYTEQLQQDKLMAKSEADIKAGSIYNLDETQKIINSWNA